MRSVHIKHLSLLLWTFWLPVTETHSWLSKKNKIKKRKEATRTGNKLSFMTASDTIRKTSQLSTLLLFTYTLYPSPASYFYLSFRSTIRGIARWPADTESTAAGVPSEFFWPTSKFPKESFLVDPICLLSTPGL